MMLERRKQNVDHGLEIKDGVMDMPILGSWRGRHPAHSFHLTSPIGYRDDLIAAFTYLPKLCSHIQFPMQSGSDTILKAMRRPYKNQKRIEICEKMKAVRSGETEEDFQMTIDTVEHLKFDNASSSATPSAKTPSPPRCQANLRKS